MIQQDIGRGAVFYLLGSAAKSRDLLKVARTDNSQVIELELIFCKSSIFKLPENYQADCCAEGYLGLVSWPL